MGITERKEREKQQRRNDIIDAAEKIIFEKGLADATMDEIAEAAELSKGTLYLYFDTKEELYKAIFLRGQRKLYDMFEAVAQEDQSGLEKTYAIGKAYQKFTEDHPEYFNAIMHYQIQELAFESQEELVTFMKEKSNNSIFMLVEAIEQGKRDGSIRNDIEAKKMAVLLWGMSNGIHQITKWKRLMLKELMGIETEELTDYFFNYMERILKPHD